MKDIRMRIVDLQTFMSMPDGTIFAKAKKYLHESLSIKVQSLNGDFLYQSLSMYQYDSKNEDNMQVLYDLENKGRIVEMNYDCCNRDGLFEKDELFAVLDRDDVVKLITRLNRALEEGYKNEQAIRKETPAGATKG
jgi:DNA relaxase NicK